MFKLNAVIFGTVLAMAPAAFAEDKAAAGPTDPQIAHIVVTANTIDIDAGKMAKAKSKNSEVKGLAQQMIADHGNVNKKATNLVKKLKVTPEDNDTSKSLKKDASDEMARLKKLKGAEFDKAYVDQEVKFHAMVLKAIDDTLIPNASNAELKTLLEETRPAIEGHLNHAKMIQAKLEK
jgi:putative membrane protein